MISMRPSRVLRKMRAGQIATSVALKFADATISEIVGQVGFDCIWIDTEHTGTTLREIENHVRAAKLFDTDLIVRVQRGSYSDLIHSLEMDATGIMVPHLMSAAEARDIARKTKFHPVGRRALDGGNTDGAFCQIPVDAYIEQANSERFVIVQIEDPEPLAELDEIAQVEGIDMLFFGPGDFSHGIGQRQQGPRQAVYFISKNKSRFETRSNRFVVNRLVRLLNGYYKKSFFFQTVYDLKRPPFLP